MKRFLDSIRDHPSRIIDTVIFLAVATLYIRTACPTLGGAFDSEEFQHVAYNLGIAHATGYPLYLILGKIFTTLFPIGNIAYRMNLLSAIIGAAAVVVVYLNALVLTRRQIASIAAAALFATNTAVWRQAGVASVGPLHLLIVAAIVYALLLWHEKRAPLQAAAFLFGLGLAHHRTTLWLAIPALIFILLEDANLLHRPREILKHIFWLALPLLLYLYLPLRGDTSPWYTNTLQGFIQHISGTDAGDFIRETPLEMLDGIALVSQYLLNSFGLLGLILIIVGGLSAIRNSPRAMHHSFFLGVATLVFYIQGAFYAGEPDRYLSLPFVFLIYWFAIGVGAIEERMKAEGRRRKRNISSFILHPSSLQTAFAILLALLIALPFAERFRTADWSTFDRTYKLWDEVFTLPIPQNATLVGNWGQLNAMRYMQRIESRRPDLKFVGTLYDAAPQTEAARAALADGQAIFLAPGIAQPIGTYRYALLGPLLQVRDSPQIQAPTTTKNIAMNPLLTLADFSIATALEPYAPTTNIAPARTARVSLTWRAESSMKDFLVRVRLYDPESRVVAQKDEAPIRGLYNASQWQSGEYVSDVHNFLIPAGSPPGKYQLKMQTLDAESKKPTGDELALATLNIDRATNLTREQVFIAQPFDRTLGNSITLWGCGGCDGARRVGETVGISLVYSVHENISEDLTLHLALVDAANKQFATWQRAPIAFYPTGQWQNGEVLKGYYDLPLPGNLPSDAYVLTIGTSPQSSVRIGKIQIAP